MEFFSVKREGYSQVMLEICRIPSYTSLLPLQPRGRNLMVSKSSCVYCAVILIALLVQSFFLLWNPSEFYLISPMVHLIYCVEQISVKVSLIIGLYYILKRRSWLEELLGLMEEIDSSFREHGHTWTARINYSMDIAVLLFLLTVSFNHFLLRPKFFYDFIKIIAYYLTMAFLYITAAKFHRIVLFQSTGFEKIHSCLASAQENKKKLSKRKLLETMIILYNKLYRITKLLNRVHSPQILLIIFCSFLISTGNIYFFYQSLCSNENYTENILRFSWIFFYSAISVLIVWPCTVIHKKAKECNILLYQVMVDDVTNNLCSNRKLLLHIAMKKEVSFTACGFFNLDFTLLHSMLAAATTYLVILIQFGQPTAKVLNESFENSSYINVTAITLPTSN